jgi:hypothetical protein
MRALVSTGYEALSWPVTNVSFTGNTVSDFLRTNIVDLSQLEKYR